MQLVGGTRHQLIGAHPVETAHEDIAEYQGEHTALQQRISDLKARIRLQTADVQGDYRNLLHTGFAKRSSEEADIVGSAAASAGLRHDDGGAVQIVFA